MTDSTRTNFKIRNWEIHQHYRDRNPPWIKLHFAILTSEDWVMWDNDARALSIVCMLIASRNHPPGELSVTKEYIQRVGFLKKAPNFTPLTKTGFLIPLDNPPEERRDRDRGETELQASASKPLASASKSSKSLVELPFQSEEFKKVWQFWREHRKGMKKPMTLRAEELILAKIPKVESEAIAWINNAIEKGWQGIYEPNSYNKQNAEPEYILKADRKENQ